MYMSHLNNYFLDMPIQHQFFNWFLTELQISMWFLCFQLKLNGFEENEVEEKGQLVVHMELHVVYVMGLAV